jgi:hypothetical protein
MAAMTRRVSVFVTVKAGSFRIGVISVEGVILEGIGFRGLVFQDFKNYSLFKRGYFFLTGNNRYVTI